MTGNVKMEDQTFVMVRDDAGAANMDPMNDVSMALGVNTGFNLLPEAADEVMEQSAFREVRDDAAGFHDALLQGDNNFQLDQSMFGQADLLD